MVKTIEAVRSFFCFLCGEWWEGARKLTEARSRTNAPALAFSKYRRRAPLVHFLTPKGVAAAPPVIIDFWSLIEKATAEPLRGRVSEEGRLRIFFNGKRSSN